MSPDLPAAIGRSHPLPVVPPPEDDELISSWLDRIARFYGISVRRLLAAYGISLGKISLGAIDEGSAMAPIDLIAAMLGISRDQLVRRTIAGAYPIALPFLARHQRGSEGQVGELRYAGCSRCVEHQRVARGFAWLRREWLLAPRTVCQHHYIPLAEGGLDKLMHPVWVGFIRDGRWAQQPACQRTLDEVVTASGSPKAAPDGAVGELYRRMAVAQTAMLSEALGAYSSNAEQRSPVKAAAVVSDVTWVLTRLNRMSTGHPIYDTFALRVIDDSLAPVSSRPQGPIALLGESIAVRHRIMAAAVALLSERHLRERLLMPDPTSIGEQFRLLLSRLTDADRVTLSERSRQWPLAWRDYLDFIFAAGLEPETTKPLRPWRGGGMRPAQPNAPKLPEAPSLLIWENSSAISTESTH